MRAVKYGRVLVVDEADKAPPHVSCVLKALIDDQYMVLPDARKIVARSSSLLAPNAQTQRMLRDCCEESGWCGGDDGEE